MPWVGQALYPAYYLLHEPKYKAAVDRYTVFFIRDGYTYDKGRTIPWPGWNIVWLMALTADGLMFGPTLESLGMQNESK